MMSPCDSAGKWVTRGGMTVTDPDSIGILIDGDKAIVNNATATMPSVTAAPALQINGDEATVDINGNTTVDGQGSGTEIAGNNAVVNQDGSAGCQRRRSRGLISPATAPRWTTRAV